VGSLSQVQSSQVKSNGLMFDKDNRPDGVWMSEHMYTALQLTEEGGEI
jgi:hypothetical protein